LLDTDTKRRIDSARDILVGKVPDPKSQVEQITIALIYKFMDDMDAESEELGGLRSFFAGDFARYGWAKLMRSGLGGHETLNLYAEAITRMPENPGVPALFRAIFKNAYLPYRDPETLRIFLKVIDEFSYDHSERLGDAFEYLLSVLGSQGDAGQFRTPRHIIDFMVKILDPKKDEKVLDPACGTAGFLISSYKHILASNKDEKGESTLTPDEKGLLARNFTGYDISPDMVRLSLVNMYLHGFVDPHIYEYDTLTSQERWNDYADVILANPPFMSPKGGIRPHNRFSVQSKRSEVLFVDYMAEHLKPNGRAAIIVPEGIIFQSQSAYVQLRKMLVEDYLVAVVSLPAGVFNPYSGVKTSILILDKELAKRSSTIGFFKVENDGYGLGAQRRAIEKNDLPKASTEIAEYLWYLQNSEPESGYKSTLGFSVEKKNIAARDYSLSMDRYREKNRLSCGKWPIVPLGKFCTFMTGGTPTSTVPEYYNDGIIPWLVSGDIHKGEIRDCERRITEKGVKNSNARYLPENSILIALNGQGKTRGTVAMLRMKATCNQSLVAITPIDPIHALPEYVFWALRKMYKDIRALTGDTERSGLSIAILKTISIPLPPFELQKEIIAEIEGYQKVIDGAQAVVDNYLPHIPIDPNWTMAELGEICDVRDGTHDSPKYGLNGFPLITSRNLKNGFIDFTDVNLISREDLDAINKRSKVDDGDILMPMIGTIGNPVIVDSSFEFAVKNVALIKFHKNSKINNCFLKNVLASAEMQSLFDRQANGSTQKFIPLGFIRSLQIPLPPICTQRAIVAEIEAEQKLVDANRELIARFEKKIQAVLARVWGESDEQKEEQK